MKGAIFLCSVRVVVRVRKIHRSLVCGCPLWYRMGYCIHHHLGKSTDWSSTTLKKLSRIEVKLVLLSVEFYPCQRRSPALRWYKEREKTFRRKQLFIVCDQFAISYNTVKNGINVQLLDRKSDVGTCAGMGRDGWDPAIEWQSRMETGRVFVAWTRTQSSSNLDRVHWRAFQG